MKGGDLRGVPARHGVPVLAGFGAYRPERVLTNDELEGRVDTSDEWIRRRTGIVTRRLAGPSDSIVSMAADAAGKALAVAGVDAAELDLVLLASCTAQAPIPGLSPQVATALGASQAGAADVNAGCSGFCYGIGLAADSIRAGSARRVLVVASERLTDWVDSDDRSMVVLFGDGAGAAVVIASDQAGGSTPAGIGPVAWGADGTAASIIEIRPRPTGERYMEMEGGAVFRWATTQLLPVALRACELAGVTPADLDVLVPHQANLRIIEALVRSLAAAGAGELRVGRDVVDAGNTSAASIPLALTRMIETGEARSGDLALLIGFGAGLTYAAQVVRVP